MIIECPECKTKFRCSHNFLELDGRTLRCSRCYHQWRYARKVNNIVNETDSNTPIEENTSNEEAELIESISFPIQNEQVADHQANSFIDTKFITASFSIFLLLTILFAWFFPIKIIQVFPQTYPIYKLLKLIPTPIIIEPIGADYRKDHYGHSILYIELKLENSTDKPKVLSPLNVELYNEDNSLIKEWPVPSRENKINAHETVQLKFGLRDAPVGGKKITIRRNLEQIYNTNKDNKNNHANDEHEQKGET